MSASNRPGSPSRKRFASALRAPSNSFSPLAASDLPTPCDPEEEPISASTAPHRGAPIGNTNALKHGFYARAFRPAEESELSSIDPSSLENEIQLLRVFILRTAIQAEKVTDLDQSLVLLNVMSRASLSLAALMRTQRAALVAHDHDQLQQIFAEAKAANVKAGALSARLDRQLTSLELAYDAALEAVTAASQTGAPESRAALPDQPAAPAVSGPNAQASPAAVTPVSDDPAAAIASAAAGPTDNEADSENDPGDPEDEADEEETEDEYCKIPFDCIACPERRTCDSCPPRLRSFPAGTNWP